ncbi:MAG: cysteine desulfurase, partial [Candidatus Berkelbacteria bacterium Licking1014_2]
MFSSKLIRKVYMDYAATTPVATEVRKAMAPYLNQKFGNPSSIHSWGQEAMAAIEKSRQQTADFLYCQPEEIIFTAGATEANNLAIFGVVKQAMALGI